ncbi:LytR/AlgR family response regulator transcription factor [Niabella hibiscisoli]|uniref:LytR/AlgR family response regulator transcription factor n=1 Tax=Niabella hibiscisoli TaxID=1825928 RepID=UPI001F0D2EEA|nr:LytTR family DNA-binding domain-containing protein [Niabella hibiscisoli]MCH5718860.1 LytTR family DNA-binding domain-containing protein [Niabella hibiscisoli]
MSSAVKCLILDDEPLAVKLVADYARQLSELEVVYAGTQVYQAMQVLQSQPVDLVFIDIQMPELSGMEFMRHFNHRHHFIITSAYLEYALNAFEFQVVDFLLKPIVFNRFKQSIEKFIQWRLNFTRAAESGYLIVRADRQYHHIAFDSLLYIEALKDYIRIHTNEKAILVWENMKDILGRLPSQQFLRIHRSYIISTQQIKLIESNRIQLTNSNWLPIGETYRKIVSDWFSPSA